MRMNKLQLCTIICMNLTNILCERSQTKKEYTYDFI